MWKNASEQEKQFHKIRYHIKVYDGFLLLYSNTCKDKKKKKKRFCSGVLFDTGNVQYQCSFIRGYLLCNHPKYNTESTSVTLVNMCAIKGAYNRYPNIVS